MRRYKNLYGEIISFQNLLKAARLTERGKRLKAATARFNFFLEKEVLYLQHHLVHKTYKPGRYRHFLIFEPKKRLISAAPYRDRVVHHAIYNVLEPVFDPTFIHDSYATRKGRGTHAALDRFQYFARKCRYALKCDIQKYFPSINHEILLAILRRKIACADTLWLLGRILDTPKETEQFGKILAASQPASQPARIGIPIGNLTSQFFANIYLNSLDHFIKENLQCKHYLRYMDDFVVFHDDKELLWSVKGAIEDYLRGLRLRLHENKCRIFATEKGVPFLGLIISSEGRRLKNANVLRFKQRMKTLQILYQKGDIRLQKIHQSMQAWIGHAKHADTGRLRELVFKKGM